MTFSRMLWQEAQESARRCLDHSFVRGLADGSLPRERYRAFIAQDAFFLEVFARGYAHGLATAPDRDGLHTFHRLLNGVFSELELHRSAAAALDIDLDHVEPMSSTLAYTDFLEECIRGDAGPSLTVASMTPCMRLYAYLGQELARGDVAGPYRAWVENYASREMEELAQTVEALLDRYTAPPGVREREQYRHAMELEYGFFKGVWDEG
ncbi:MAG: TenA family protein [Dehalococcoidia bacterium]|nr:TenA family protein [Dehalococcoidia bacterium]